jgi:alkylglycerol monooxygenase
MGTNYMALAIPFFIVSMILEITISYFKKDKLYRFNDSISNLSNGLGQQAMGVFSRVFAMYCYTWFYNNFSLQLISANTPMNFLIAMIVADLAYYWFHRASHRINLLVGSHVVHHQSEEYNLSVAMRQSWLTRFYSWFFYLPLAFLGASPETFMAVMSFVIIYQFWVHTQYIGKMGILEHIVVTPSHHRVHHGRNPKYVDRNYGAILIVWDKLFGTFQAEEEEVVYGIINQANTWNPVYANVRHYKNLWNEAKRADTISDKVKLWVSPPEWRPRNLEPYGEIPNITKETLEKYDVEKPGLAKVWIFSQFIFTLILFGYITKFKATLAFEAKAYVALLIIWSLANIGALQESKKWFMPMQIAFFTAVGSFILLTVNGTL